MIDRPCGCSTYSDGLLVVGQHTALALQVALLVAEQQMELSLLLLPLLQAVVLVVHGSLQQDTVGAFSSSRWSSHSLAPI